MLKADDKGKPERATAASVIGAAFYDAIGFNTSCEQIVTVKQDMLKLTPGLVVIDNGGISHPFDEAALDKVLESTTQLGNGLVRMQASKWLPGYTDRPVPLHQHAQRRSERRDRSRGPPRAPRQPRARRVARPLGCARAELDGRVARRRQGQEEVVAGLRQALHPRHQRHARREVTLDDMSRRLGYAYEFDIKDIGRALFTFGARRAAVGPRACT